VVVVRGEAYFAAALAAIDAEFPDVAIGSYPFRRGGRFAVEVVVRGGDPARVDTVIDRVVAAMAEDVEEVR
jgi:hypothetical protein